MNAASRPESSAASRVTAAAAVLALVSAVTAVGWAEGWNAYITLMLTLGCGVLWIVFRLSMVQLLRGWRV
jgi:hypothetical protein